MKQKQYNGKENYTVLVYQFLLPHSKLSQICPLKIPAYCLTIVQIGSLALCDWVLCLGPPETEIKVLAPIYGAAIWRPQERIHFRDHSGYWQKSALCSHRSEVPVSLAVSQELLSLRLLITCRPLSSSTPKQSHTLISLSVTKETPPLLKGLCDQIRSFWILSIFSV